MFVYMIVCMLNSSYDMMNTCEVMSDTSVRASTHTNTQIHTHTHTVTDVLLRHKTRDTRDERDMSELSVWRGVEWNVN